MSNIAKKSATAKQVLANHYFTRGVRDKIAERGFDCEYDSWSPRAQALYEWGRQYVAASGSDFMHTKYGPGNKRVNPVAIRRFCRQTMEGVYC